MDLTWVALTVQYFSYCYALSSFKAPGYENLGRYVKMRSEAMKLLASVGWLNLALSVKVLLFITAGDNVISDW